MELTGDDLQIESAAAELTSGIQKASAVMMKAAYLPAPSKKGDTGFGAPFFKIPSAHHDEEVPGPDALVYLTKISGCTPGDEISRILGPAADISNHDFYTLLFYLNIQLNEPSTTRFINAVVTFTFPPEITILNYSPREKEIIVHIAQAPGDEVFLSRALVLTSSVPPGAETDDRGQRFDIRIGPEEKITVSRSKKHGYTLNIPKHKLLEYEGMRKNSHEVLWEIYPRMPPEDSEITRREKQAFFSVIVQVPQNTHPEVTVRIKGKVKGKIWGVVPLYGSVVF